MGVLCVSLRQCWLLCGGGTGEGKNMWVSRLEMTVSWSRMWSLEMDKRGGAHIDDGQTPAHSAHSLRQDRICSCGR